MVQIEYVRAADAPALAEVSPELVAEALAGTVTVGCALDTALLLAATPLPLPAGLAVPATVAVAAPVGLACALASALEDCVGKRYEGVCAGEAVGSGDRASTADTLLLPLAVNASVDAMLCVYSADWLKGTEELGLWLSAPLATAVAEGVNVTAAALSVAACVT